MSVIITAAEEGDDDDNNNKEMTVYMQRERKKNGMRPQPEAGRKRGHSCDSKSSRGVKVYLAFGVT